MFCPKCGDEYRAGITACAECGLSLVERMPVEPEKRDEPPVTILITRDPGLLAVAKSLLTGSSIPLVATGEIIQEVVGRGVSELVEIQVPAELASDARRVLGELGKHGHPRT